MILRNISYFCTAFALHFGIICLHGAHFLLCIFTLVVLTIHVQIAMLTGMLTGNLAARACIVKTKKMKMLIMFCYIGFVVYGIPETLFWLRILRTWCALIFARSVSLGKIFSSNFHKSALFYVLLKLMYAFYSLATFDFWLIFRDWTGSMRWIPMAWKSLSIVAIALNIT